MVASRWDVFFTLRNIIHNMKIYEILSKTQDGKLVAVVSTEASDAKHALRRTANFCYMMDIEVHSVVVAGSSDADASLVHGPI